MCCKETVAGATTALDAKQYIRKLQGEGVKTSDAGQVAY